MATWKKVVVSGSNISELNNDSGYIASVGGGIVSGSTFASSNQGEFTATINGVDTTVDLGLQTGDSPTFGTVTADLTGTASIATKLTDARDFAISGDATATAVSFDGTGNVTLSVSLGNNVVDTAELAVAAVDSASIAADAITADHIANNAITNAMMQDDSVDSAEIADGAIDEVHFSAGAETAISGAFTSTSASIAADIAALEVGAFDLQVNADSGPEETITNAESFDVSGSTHISTRTTTNGVVITLENDLNITSVTASIQGDVAGNVTGNVTGDVTGDLTGNVTGNVTGDLTGNVTGNVTGTADTASYVAVANIDGTIDITSQTNLSVTDTSGQTGIDLTLSAGDALSGVLAGLDTTDSPTFANLTLTGDLTVQGTKTELNVANLNVEDQFILLNSGSTSGDSGIIFGGTGNGVANSGHAIFVDDSDNDGATFGYASNLAHDTATGGAPVSKLGNIESSTSNPSAAPTFQGVGTIHIKTDTEDIWIYA